MIEEGGFAAEETDMPHIIVKLAAGRTTDQKARLAEALTQSLVAVLGCEEAAVSVGIEDVDPEAWFSQVYGPDIQEKQETIFKKPGYDPA